MQSWIHGLDPNSFEVSGKTPAAFNSGRTGAHLAPVSVPEKSLLERARSLLKNYFFIKKLNSLELKYFPGTCWFWQDICQETVWFSDKKHRNDLGCRGLGAHLGTRAPGSKYTHWETAMRDPKQHCSFPCRKPSAFWLRWVSVTLVLVKWKMFVTLSLSSGAHLHNRRCWCWQEKSKQPYAGQQPGQETKVDSGGFQKQFRCCPHSSLTPGSCTSPLLLLPVTARKRTSLKQLCSGI